MSQEKAIIVCDECKHEFYLDAVGIHEAIVELNGVPVTLVYFACPKCNKIYKAKGGTAAGTAAVVAAGWPVADRKSVV